MEASELAVLQSVVDGQKALEGSIGMLTDAFKRLISTLCHVQGDATSEPSPIAPVAPVAPPEASPSAPVAEVEPAPPLAETTDTGSNSTEATAFGHLAPNHPPDLPGTFKNRAPEESTTRGGFPSARNKA